MITDKTRKAQGERLADARSRAGWRSARAAALENGWAESSYRAHENGSRTIGQDDAETYARRFRAAGVQISAQDILFGSTTSGAHTTAPPSDVGPRTPLAPNAARGGPRDLPNLGTAVGGSDGDFRLNGEVLEQIARPPALVGRKKAFSVNIRNDSMHPAYRDGWPIYVDPDGLRPSIGDEVLLELYPEQDGEPGAAFVKTLVARGATEIVVSQFNPPKELRFEAARVKQILRVIPYVELFGV